MKRLQAFKFELMPNGEQQRNMRRFAGACRFVFNKALALENENRSAGNKLIGYNKMANHLPVWKVEFPWLKEAPSQALQQTLKDLYLAFDRFFKEKKGGLVTAPDNRKERKKLKLAGVKMAHPPVFKKKGQSEAGIRFPQGTELDQTTHRVKLPKLGWLRYRCSRDVIGTIKNVTVSSSGGKWYVSLQTEREVELPVPQGDAVGIDVGIARFATLSDGTVYAPLNSFKRHETALRKAQQAMSHKTKFSNNWKKAKARVQRIHSRIGNTRRDFLHKTSNAISQNHALVFVEDLRIRNMSKSAAGTTEAPGKQVRAKSGLNKSILDQGWFEFRRQLDYKLAWKGGHLVAVPPRNTSRTCPCCGHVSAENRQTQAKFECVECGFEENADLVGAINVLRAGHARLACEVNGAVMPSAAGTHRSVSGAVQCRA